jgi:hypothetical protein
MKISIFIIIFFAIDIIKSNYFHKKDILFEYTAKDCKISNILQDNQNKLLYDQRNQITSINLNNAT